MRHVPREPREGINVSETHPLAEAGLLVGGVAALFAALAVAIIFLVELAVFFVSPATEARLFEDWAPEGMITLDAGDERTPALQLLLDRLAAHADDSPYTYRLAVMSDEAPNALAFPGGWIVVTSGLLDRVESENELAFVLGHELGHFRNRDHLRTLGRGVALGLLFGALIGSDTQLGVTVTDLASRSFDRGQESAADEFGLELVQAEYGHVAEAGRFFERLETEGLGVSGALTYLSTHPSTAERGTVLEAYAQERGWRLEGPLTEISW